MDDERVIKIDDIELYDNDFEIAIDEACQKYGIEDLVKEGQRRWKRVMRYVGQHIFPDNKVLKDKNIVILEGNKIPTNNNRYDYNILDILCDYYIDLSNQYNKYVSTEGFSYFVNVPKDTIDNWKHSESSSLSFRIWKKIQGIRLESIKDDALDNGNVTGTIAVGNWEFNLNMPGVREERKAQQLISREEMGLEAPKERPTLPGTVENS